MSRSAAETPLDPVLEMCLQTAVPMWIERFKAVSWAEAYARRDHLADVVASYSDNLQFKSKKPGATANAFNGLAEGLALLAFGPGGITFCGLHWEAIHPDHQI